MGLHYCPTISDRNNFALHDRVDTSIEYFLCRDLWHDPVPRTGTFFHCLCILLLVVCKHLGWSLNFNWRFWKSRVALGVALILYGRSLSVHSVSPYSVYGADQAARQPEESTGGVVPCLPVCFNFYRAVGHCVFDLDPCNSFKRPRAKLRIQYSLALASVFPWLLAADQTSPAIDKLGVLWFGDFSYAGYSIDHVSMVRRHHDLLVFQERKDNLQNRSQAHQPRQLAEELPGRWKWWLVRGINQAANCQPTQYDL